MTFKNPEYMNKAIQNLLDFEAALNRAPTRTQVEIDTLNTLDALKKSNIELARTLIWDIKMPDWIILGNVNITPKGSVRTKLSIIKEGLEYDVYMNLDDLKAKKDIPLAEVANGKYEIKNNKLIFTADPPVTPVVQAAQETKPNGEKFQRQISALNIFLKKPHPNSFWVDLMQDAATLSALKEILWITTENTTYKEIQDKTRVIQTDLKIIPADGAFGKDTLKKWIASEKYRGGKEVITATVPTVAPAPTALTWVVLAASTPVGLISK